MRKDPSLIVHAYVPITWLLSEITSPTAPGLRAILPPSTSDYRPPRFPTAVLYCFVQHPVGHPNQLLSSTGMNRHRAVAGIENDRDGV